MPFQTPVVHTAPGTVAASVPKIDDCVNRLLSQPIDSNETIYSPELYRKLLQPLIRTTNFLYYIINKNERFLATILKEYSSIIDKNALYYLKRIIFSVNSKKKYIDKKNYPIKRRKTLGCI